jgi:hypothetical protein
MQRGGGNWLLGRDLSSAGYWQVERGMDRDKVGMIVFSVLLRSDEMERGNLESRS